MPGEVWQYLLGAAATVFVAWLGLRGAKFTASKAKEGVDRTAAVSAQESALKAWEAMNQPLMDRVDWLEKRMKAADREHESERVNFQKQVTRLTERVDLQAEQIKEWKRVAKVIARWATAMRDEILRLKGTLPATPDELLTLQAIEDAEQS